VLFKPSQQPPKHNKIHHVDTPSCFFLNFIFDLMSETACTMALCPCSRLDHPTRKDDDLFYGASPRFTSLMLNTISNLDDSQQILVVQRGGAPMRAKEWGRNSPKGKGKFSPPRVG